MDQRIQGARGIRPTGDRQGLRGPRRAGGAQQSRAGAVGVTTEQDVQLLIEEARRT